MAFEVTATRRRPQQFESLAGQEFVVSTLKNAIEQGRIAHAYLFSGPRGVGKTTCARLLAKALNCVNGPTGSPCGECENCRGIAKGNNIDVIEIDGASNTGVNDVRVIKEEVMFPPASSRYKIYIIDEVHMLSQSAFNALLKTIEEPPEYVVFIFATTETQKVPATIRSRCQQFNFQLIGIETIKRLLGEAAREMGIEAEDEALFWIAKEATGSMRDAYTLFDQVVSFSNGKITLAQIREKLGLVGVERINGIIEDLLSEDKSSALSKIQDLLAKGMSIDQIIKDFTSYFRSILLIKEGVKSENILGEQLSSFPENIINAYNLEQIEAALELFLKLYRDIRYSLNPRFELELAVSRLVMLRYIASNSAVIEQIARLKNDLINGNITPLNQNMKDIPPVEPVSGSVIESGKKQAVVKSPESAVSECSNDVSEDLSSTKKGSPDLNSTPADSDNKITGSSSVHEEKPAEEHSESNEEKTDEAVTEVKKSEPSQVPVNINPSEYTIESLSPVLPQGVGSIQVNENGLVLQFGSRFFYQMAFKDLDNVRSRIQTVTGPEINVVLAFSEKLEQKRNIQIGKTEPKQSENKQPEVKGQGEGNIGLADAKPVEAPKTEAKPIQVEEDESKFFVDDLINAFRGREEK